MDSMIQSYMDETEEMLQRAEECVIRLESEYSAVDVNELFRIAHTIKGSSQMVGYEDIGNLMHKIEDMLDYARNDSIIFDQSIVSLCFEGLDAVKKMLQYKKEPGPEELIVSMADSVSRISEMVEVFVRLNKKEEQKAIEEQPGTGIISSLLSKKPKGKNKFHISIFIEEDAPMVSPVLIMVLKSIEEIGTLMYSSVSDYYFSGKLANDELKTFDFIINTDIDEVELYTYFALFYVERINIVNLTRSKLQQNDFCFNNTDNSSYGILFKALLKLFNQFFRHSEHFKITSEELNILKDLHSRVNMVFDSMKTDMRISGFIQDFNNLYTSIIRIHEDNTEMNQELCTTIQTQIVNLLEKAYAHIRGRYLFKIFKSEKDDFIKRLKAFIELVNKSSTLVIFIDISELSILQENEIKDLIEIKRKLEYEDIEVIIIVNGSNARKNINIFDSIKPIEEFKVYGTEIDAILGRFHMEDWLLRLSKIEKDVCCE